MGKSVKGIYEFESIEHYELITTTLYSLPPVGAKGKDVESLSSYITRLANAHNLRINQLFSKIIIPKYNNHLLDFHSQHINGFGPLTNITVSALEDYTKQKYLGRLTMSNFINVLSKLKLLKSNKSWCPSCFQAMRDNQNIVYEKLIWNISEYEICMDHLCKLEDQCRKCKRNLGYLTTISMNGYCNYCGCWLGDRESIFRESNNSSEKIYKSNQLELVFNYYQDKILNIERFLNSLRIIGNRLPRELLIQEINSDVQFSNFQKYYLKKLTPTIQILLSISYNLKINLIDILECRNIETHLDKYEKTYHYNYKLDYSKFRSHLEKAVYSMEVTPLNKLALELNTSRKTLRIHFPELTSAIKAKNYLLRRDGNLKVYQYNHNNESEKEQVRNYLIECLESTDNLSLEKIAKNLNVAPQTLAKRFPELVQQIRNNYSASLEENKIKFVKNKGEPQGNKKVQDYDYEEVNHKLLEILNAITDEPFYIKDIAKILGISDGRLRRNFSDIINKISEKNTKVIQLKRKKIQEEYEKRIIDTIKLLCEKGIYPGVENVQKHLNFTVNNVRYLKVWRATLTELGIEKKKGIK